MVSKWMNDNISKNNKLLCIPHLNHWPPVTWRQKCFILFFFSNDLTSAFPPWRVHLFKTTEQLSLTFFFCTTFFTICTMSIAYRLETAAVLNKHCEAPSRRTQGCELGGRWRLKSIIALSLTVSFLIQLVLFLSALPAGSLPFSTEPRCTLGCVQQNFPFLTESIFCIPSHMDTSTHKHPPLHRPKSTSAAW